jgi:N-acetylmuramoyl-L-alanine amidase
VLAIAAAFTTGAADGDTLALNKEMRVRVGGGRSLALEILPREGEDRLALLRRVCAGPIKEQLVVAGDGAIRIPLPLLRPEYRAVALRNVFPDDALDGPDWVHTVRRGRLAIVDEGLWQVAEWFTGDGKNFEELQRVNGLASPELRPGQLVRIPAALLDAGLAPGPRSDDGTLVYGKDERGEYAAYRLKPGEALYSAVVLRYTGRTSWDDVNAVAKEIAARSDVRDPTDIPIAWMLKIPLDLLEPEFLPPSDPRRKSREKEAEAVERELAERPQKKEEKPGAAAPIVVILDPGHGGLDPGTMNHGIWEHDYCFDVATRLKRELERRKGVKVYLTLDDPATGPVPSSGDVLTANRRRTVLTTPPFLVADNGETAIGVNLRWYLANSLYRRAVKAGTDPDHVVFVSLHADARHPSLRGAMVYVPGARYREGAYGSSSETYLRFQEVREKPRLTFNRKDRLRSEAVSRKLAASLVKELRKGDLPIQPYQPIRDRIIRGDEIWLPAVLKGNAIPAKVLIEMVNMSNEDDAALLARAADRDRLAASLARGLTSFLGVKAR